MVTLKAGSPIYHRETFLKPTAGTLSALTVTMPTPLNAPRKKLAVTDKPSPADVQNHHRLRFAETGRTHDSSRRAAGDAEIKRADPRTVLLEIRAVRKLRLKSTPSGMRKKPAAKESA